ncbi:hypothetical protein AX16_003596 [Volvariella volvacea WC 439]|nr:hypothetical protein AX16_003596 [Volvariella volvacea WC 439]
MSRLTAAQVITRGEYLEADFDSASLTVSQLLGVLNYHNIRYPTPYSKAKLVQLFNDEIKSRTAQLKKERSKRENSNPSDDGITDGVTGQPIAATRKSTAPRRSTRRSSRLHAVQDEDSEPISPAPPAEPPKRRRSSAQPNLGGPRPSQIVPTESPLAEESEPEEVPPRKFGKSKKNADIANSHARKVSNPFSEYEDSGWEDNNIFQSGAEDSSPVRPVKPRTRKSTAPRKSRKSMSAPPQVSLLPQSPPQSPLKPPIPKPEPSTPAQKPPSKSAFQPSLPVSVSHETDKIIRLLETPGKAPRMSLKAEGDVSVSAKQEKITDRTEPEELPSLGGTSEVEEVTHVDDADQIGDEDRVSPAASPEQTLALTLQGLESERWPIWLRILFILFTLISARTLYNYKTESASIGFCERERDSNEVLDSLRAHRAAVEACNRENRTLLYPPSPDASSSTPCPLPSLLPPFMHPNECTPCPDHATCQPHAVVCDNGYILRPHPFLFFLPSPAFPAPPTIAASSPSDLVWRLLSAVGDGVPGIGSIALPPRCIADPKRKRNIGVLGKAIEAMLGQERGRRVCAGGEYLELNMNDKDGGEARKWGVEVENLRDVMRQKTSPNLLTTFDDTFNEALQQLIQWGGVVIGEDQQGHRYLAHKTPDLTWNCALTVKSREIWAKWRTTVFGIGFLTMIALYGRTRRVQKQAEGKRIAELVQIALDALRNQELAHYTDPITAPHPYLSSVQLRDLILQDEHSVSKRQRLWGAVERVVEGNTNVRANLEETGGGEEMRVWRWIGSAGRTSSGWRKSIAGANAGDIIQSVEQGDS